MLRKFAEFLYGKFPAASLDDAMHNLERAAEVAPTVVAHRVELGVTLADSRRWHEANDALTKALAMPKAWVTDDYYWEVARKKLRKVNREINSNERLSRRELVASVREKRSQANEAMPATPSTSSHRHRADAPRQRRCSKTGSRASGSKAKSPISARRQSGHVYFTLKDANAQLAAVLFRGVAAKVEVQAQGRLAGHRVRRHQRLRETGQYQIIVRQLLPKGLGALQLAFEELKQPTGEGRACSTADRKKPIPLLPQRIGLVTSPTGAAIRDFLNIIGRPVPERPHRHQPGPRSGRRRGAGDRRRD